MAKVRGVLLNAWAKLLDRRYGTDRVAKARDGLSPQERGSLPLIFLDSDWYSFDALNAMRNLTRSLAGPDDKDLGIKIGRFMAEQAFTGAYKVMLAKDPVKQVAKFSHITEFFFQEARTLETEMASPNACTVRYHYHEGTRPNRGICQSLTGFWMQALEMSGASGVKGAHSKCVLNGADCCEFKFEWS